MAQTHAASFLIGSALAGFSFLLIDRECSYRSSLSSHQWPLMEQAVGQAQEWANQALGNDVGTRIMNKLALTKNGSGGNGTSDLRSKWNANILKIRRWFNKGD